MRCAFASVLENVDGRSARIGEHLPHARWIDVESEMGDEEFDSSRQDSY